MNNNMLQSGKNAPGVGRCRSLRSIVLATMLTLGLAAGATAQRVTVTGKVTAEDNTPLVGSSVVLKGTQTGTTTDAKGNYSISIPTGPNATLVFNYIGYQTREERVGTRKVIDVKLAEDAAHIDDVVVIGYGTALRTDISGSIATPDMKDMYKAPVASIDEALAGRVAGVQVTSTEGQPGSQINIVIRGQNSITQSNSPLFVVDGMPLEDFNFNTMNPADIKSMTILKDASSTAIYGARGANGVIILETYAGQVGKAQITYDGSYGWQQVISEVEMMNGYEFVKLQQEINPSMFRSQYLLPDSSDRETRSMDYYKNVPYINWMKEALHNAPFHNHRLSVSGGSKDTRYNLSFNYMNQEGIVITTGFERFGGRIRLDQYINPDFRVGVNASYSQTRSYGSTVRNANLGYSADLTAMYNLWGYRPLAGDKTLEEYMEEGVDEEIHGSSAGNRVNPLTALRTEKRNYYNYDLNARAYAEYTIAKYFLLSSSVGFVRGQGQNEIYYGPGHPATSATAGVEKGINGSSQYTLNTRIVNENTLNFTRMFKGVHSVNATVGFTVETQKYSNFKGEAWFIARDLGISGLDEGTAYSNTGYSVKQENSRLGMLGRVMYTYDSRYSLTASFRRDGSSRFADNNKWAFFPSVAVSWRPTQEAFLRDSKVFTDIKLRASFGLTGNDRVGPFDYKAQLTISEDKGTPWNNQEPGKGAEATRMENNSLKWETTETWDMGLDAALWDSRLELVVDLYHKKTRDLLLWANFPGSSGYTRGLVNIGSVQNKGLEITLNAVPVDTKKFVWNANFNIAFNRSKVLSLNRGQDYMESSTNSNIYSNVPLYIAQVGRPIAMFQGLRWIGNYQVSDFTWQNGSDETIPHSERQYVLKDGIPTNGTERNQIRPGHIRYQDITNLEAGTIDSEDRVIIGDPNPKFIGGFSNNFYYKGFDLNVFFQFSYGNEVMNVNRLLFEGTYRYGLNQFASYQDRWSCDNPGSKNFIPGGGGNPYFSDRTLEDGSFLRLKTVSLGYTLPESITKKLRLQRLRVYFSAQNLFTWTKYSGFDPEVSIGGSALTPGLDYLSYPRARTFTAGISITL